MFCLPTVDHSTASVLNEPIARVYALRCSALWNTQILTEILVKAFNGCRAKWFTFQVPVVSAESSLLYPDNIWGIGARQWLDAATILENGRKRVWYRLRVWRYPGCPRRLGCRWRHWNCRVPGCGGGGISEQGHSAASTSGDGRSAPGRSTARCSLPHFARR